MATRQLKKHFDAVSEWLDLAQHRVEVPADWLEIEYQEDADLLYIKISNSKAASSKADLDDEVVFDYDETGELVGIEILNFYGVFASV
ncbi:MAG: DUF2283 domain-containing protein [Pyrinomonadaceae bacterium]|nr:DUF2283 domain-containing protein [Pyrinomonadaceae bacterium]